MPKSPKNTLNTKIINGDNMSDKEIASIDQRIDKSRIREKDSNTLKSIESVFDFQTSMLIVKMMNTGILSDIGFCVSTGKEANVYHGYGEKKEELAIKIYRTASAEFKKNWIYVQGDPRFKSYKKGTYAFIYTWAKKEFKNLKRMNKIGVRSPIPIAIQKNVLVMEFIGKSEKAAPLLKDSRVKKPHKLYAKILDYMTKMYEDAKLIHADLSEYNILMLKQDPVFIDVSQAVLLDHPYAAAFLFRDIKNINRYFSSLGVEILPNEELYEQITDSPPSPKIQTLEI
ncbi:MAG: serine protein kinase RIO [Candidatus Heimdallarchaeota archaeon]|nr:serine protein kinase RIO [Candidatus Heimdallarchaeota archaeon]